jgi:outer membrane protein TolC
MSPFSNNRKFRKTCLLRLSLFLHVLPVVVAAQSPLTLHEALTLGLSNHYGIRMARNEATMARENVTPGNAGMLPQVAAFGQLDKASLDAEVHTSLGTRIDKDAAAVSLFSAGVQAQWTLFDGTVMFLEFDRLKSQSNLANLSLQNEMEDAIHGITEAYFNMVRQKNNLESFREQMHVSQMRYSLAKLKYHSGAGSELEMIQAEVTHLADSTAFTRQQTVLQNAGLELNKLMAADLELEVVPADSITLVELPPLADLLADALRDNTSRLYSGEIHHLRELELKLARAKKLPRLVMKGAYLFTQNETEASLINYTRTLGPQVGLNASVSLFDGFNVNRRISRAKTSLENQTIHVEETEQELTALIMEAWYNHQNLLQLITLGRQRNALARKNLTIASEGYEAGSISSLQLREAQTDLFLSQANLTEALYQARVTESMLLKIAGQLVKTGYQEKSGAPAGNP